MEALSQSVTPARHSLSVASAWNSLPKRRTMSKGMKPKSRRSQSGGVRGGVSLPAIGGPLDVGRLEVGEGLERSFGGGREASQGVFKPPVIGERGVGLGEARVDGGEADGLANECPEFSDGTA